MQRVKILAAVTFVTVTLLTSTRFTNAQCCYGSVTNCGDCSDADPYCGKGTCNMFGCNCEGGCRTGECSENDEAGAYDAEETPNAEAIRFAGDIDEDDLLSVKEAGYLMELSPGPGNPVNVNDLDRNGDGFISESEINSWDWD